MTALSESRPTWSHWGSYGNYQRRAPPGVNSVTRIRAELGLFRRAFTVVVGVAQQERAMRDIFRLSSIISFISFMRVISVRSVISVSSGISVTIVTGVTLLALFG